MTILASTRGTSELARHGRTRYGDRFCGSDHGGQGELRHWSLLCSHPLSATAHELITSHSTSKVCSRAAMAPFLTPSTCCMKSSTAYKSTMSISQCIACHVNALDRRIFISPDTKCVTCTLDIVGVDHDSDDVCVCSYPATCGQPPFTAAPADLCNIGPTFKSSVASSPTPL
jgi:hypothetical protein